MSNEGFVSEGREEFPSLYQDYQQVEEYATWPQEALMEKYDLYTQFLSKDDLMPRARETATLIHRHVEFELKYRAGFYD